MINAVSVATAQHAEIISVAGHVRQKLADLKAGLASGPERFHRTKQRVLCHLATCHHLTKTLGQRLARIPNQIRLGIPQVHVTGAAVHKKP